MPTFNGTVDQIENNTLKVNEINDTNPEGAYPSVEAVKDFLAQYTVDYIVEQGTVDVTLYSSDNSTPIGVSMPIRYRIFNSGIKEIFFAQNNQNFTYLSAVDGMYASFKISDLPFSVSKCICSTSSITVGIASVQHIGTDVTHTVDCYKNVIELFTKGNYHDGYRVLNGHMVFE